MRFDHHALLLISKYLGPGKGIPPQLFCELAEANAGITFRSLGCFENEDEFWAEICNHPDVWMADRTKTNLNLDDLAGLKERAHFLPQKGLRRIFCIDGAHRLTNASANSLLKVLEEPQCPALFILTARSRQSVLNTVASRCQSVAVPPVHFKLSPEDNAPTDELTEKLQLIFKGTKGYKPQPQLNNSQQVFKMSEAVCVLAETRNLIDALALWVAKSVMDGNWSVTDLRYALSDLRSWERAMDWNGSSQLWMTRFLLSLHRPSS